VTERDQRRVDAVLQRRAVTDQVQAKAGQFALAADRRRSLSWISSAGAGAAQMAGPVAPATGKAAAEEVNAREGTIRPYSSSSSGSA
jgi:hypothetical protein